MKKFGIMVIALAMVVLMTGIVMADTGVNQTFETQGVSLVTSISAKGNMFSASDVTWKQSSATELTKIPPAPAAGSYYVSTYSEETMSNGVGYIDYDKNTELETKSRLTGQYNIEATKEIAFEGLNGAEITSTDNIFMDGTGNYSKTAEQAICVFAASTSEYIPRFCNTVEMGSTFTMEVVNARTETNDRFVVPSADTPVAMNHNIRVDYLGTLPSEGKVSAFAEGSVMEGRGTSTSYYEKIEWREESMADGLIYLFDKDMAYESGIRRV
jgi:hypothetical protein